MAMAQQVRSLAYILVAIAVIASGICAQAETIVYSGTNFDIKYSDPVLVGNTPLKAITLTAVGKNGALPNTFDSTKSGLGGLGITTTGNELHQIWEFSINGSPTPTNSLIVSGSIPQERDSHFLINSGQYLSGQIGPSENKIDNYAVEHAFGGFGNALFGTFTLIGASNTSWNFAYLVVPDMAQVRFDFEIGADKFSSETVGVSFVVPEPSPLVLLVMLSTVAAGLLLCARRRSKA
jgi:hypothetical protein